MTERLGWAADVITEVCGALEKSDGYKSVALDRLRSLAGALRKSDRLWGQRSAPSLLEALIAVQSEIALEGHLAELVEDAIARAEDKASYDPR